MTCQCGAFKTYKAPKLSSLHSDWCDDSVFHKVAEVDHFCHAHSAQKAAFSVEYPLNYVGLSGGQTLHWCDFCVTEAVSALLISRGCTVIKLK